MIVYGYNVAEAILKKEKNCKKSASKFIVYL